MCLAKLVIPMDSWLVFYGSIIHRQTGQGNFNVKNYFAEALEQDTVKGFTATDGDGV